MKLKHRILNFFAFISVVCMVIGCRSTTTTITATSTNGTTKTVVCEADKEAIQETQKKEEEKQFTIEAVTSLKSTVKVTKETELYVTVTNHGEDFSGYLQVLLPNTYNENTMFQKDLTIAAGETKNITYVLDIRSYSSKIGVRVVNEKEKVLQSKKIKLGVINMNETFRGGLTNDTTGLNYIGESYNPNSYEVVHIWLDKDNFPESAEALDPLDELYINNFNTSQLSENQYTALKEWVKQGGNLIIGTGENVDEAMAIFEDDFLTGTIGKVSNEGKVDITLDGGEEFTRNGYNFTKVEKGSGTIFVFHENIAIKRSLQKQQGEKLINCILQNTDIKSDVQNNYKNLFNYLGTRGLNLLDKDTLPTVKNYAYILIVYILIITVGLFMVLKKKDKQEWSWWLIPAASVICGIVIYCMGASTRITDPFITYSKRVFFAREGEKQVVEENVLQVTTPNNKEFSLVIPNGQKFSVYDDDYYYDDDNDLSDYYVGFKEVGEKQLLTFKNQSAFGSTTIRTENQAEYGEGYTSDIKYENYECIGTFTNHTGHDLNYAFMQVGIQYYALGNIKDGETVEITKDTPSIIFQGMYYQGDGTRFEDFIKNNFPAQDEIELKRYRSIFLRYMSEASYYRNSGASYGDASIIANMEDEASSSLNSEWGIKCKGSTLAIMPIDVDFRNEKGEEFVQDLLNENITITAGYVDEEYRTTDEDGATIEYTLKENETLTGIYYPAKFNAKLNKDVELGVDTAVFKGKIMIYDYKKEKFVQLFETNKEGSVTDLENYINEDNCVTFKISAKNNRAMGEAVPVLSMTKEVR